MIETLFLTGSAAAVLWGCIILIKYIWRQEGWGKPKQRGDTPVKDESERKRVSEEFFDIIRSIQKPKEPQ